MIQQPLISVIVPIYGIERYVGICIESIVNQTYKNLEIILVDDGSPDRCGEICDLYAKKDPRIKVIHKANGGLVSARKAGIKLATGDYSTYVDGDDWIEKDYYQSLVEKINDADVVVSRHKRMLFDQVVEMPVRFSFGEYEGEALNRVKAEMISYGKFFKVGISTYVWNKLFKTNLLKKYQLLVDDDITIGEDAAVVYPLINEANKIVIVDVSGYRYRQREDSMLKKSKPFSEEIVGLKKLYSYLSSFAKTNKNNNYQKQVDDFILGNCVIRSGAIKVNGKLTLPFGKDFEKENIAIYSAGTFGQQLAKRIEECGYCNIVNWVDNDYWEYRRCCLNVDPVSELTRKSFDYLLIATVDVEHAKELKEQFVGDGIEESKILCINIPEHNKQGLLKRYLND